MVFAVSRHAAIGAIVLVGLLAGSAAAQNEGKPKPAAPLPDKSADAGVSRYCANVAPVAAEARIAWETRHLNELDEQIKQRIAELEKAEAETRDWVSKRDALLNSASDDVVAIYGKMDPEAAAAQLATMDEPIAVSIEQLRAVDELGPVRSASPRAFAPTVPSTPPPAEGATLTSTKMRVSQLGSAHPTTGGGAFSLERPAAREAHGTLASLMGSRRRSLGLGVAGAAVAIIASASLYGYRSSSPPLRDPALLTSGSPAADDLATAMPIGLEIPALAKPKPDPPAAVGARVSSSPTVAPLVTPSPPVATTAKSHATPPAPVTSASAAAAQGGVVVTVPY